MYQLIFVILASYKVNNYKFVLVNKVIVILRNLDKHYISINIL